MERSFTIPWTLRFVAHFLLVAEQILGRRIFAAALAPLRALIYRRIARRAAGASAPAAGLVERIEGLTPARFRTEFFNRGRAVIFSGAARAWPCCRKWDLDFFSLGLGSSDLLLMQSHGLTTREQRSDHEFLTVRELISHIRAGSDRYLRFSPLLHDHPELASDLDLAWLAGMRPASTFGNTYYMFLGGRGQKTLLHSDQPCNLYVQIHGRKRWTLFYPGDSVCLYPEVTNSAYVKSPVDIDQPDSGRFPLFRNARAFTAVLEPGDVLYVPPHVWHQVENLDDTIAVGYRFSSMRAALKSSLAFSLIRILSTNPPVWRTRRLGRIDTNLIWADSAGKIVQVMKEREERRRHVEPHL